MKKTITVGRKDDVVLLTSGIVYAQRPFWCNAGNELMQLSLMRPRCNFPYDRTGIHPVIVFLAGGSFREVDRNVWMPELVYFAKHGYAVASVEYGTSMKTKFPDQIIEIKSAIRFLRAHAADLHLDPKRFAVMGESAGGYFSGLVGLTGKTKEYDKGENLAYESSVSAAVTWYLPQVATSVVADPRKGEIPFDAQNYPVLSDLASQDAPPFLLLHGTADTLVPPKNSEDLYNALVSHGAKADLYEIEGADHADLPFVQEETKKIILDFLDRALAVTR